MTMTVVIKSSLVFILEHHSTFVRHCLSHNDQLLSESAAGCEPHSLSDDVTSASPKSSPQYSSRLAIRRNFWQLIYLDNHSRTLFRSCLSHSASSLQLLLLRTPAVKVQVYCHVYTWFIKCHHFHFTAVSTNVNKLLWYLVHSILS